MRNSGRATSTSSLPRACTGCRPSPRTRTGTGCRRSSDLKALKKLARRAAPARKSTVRKANGAGHHETQHAVEQFLYRQAELLDAKQWEGYLDLFAAEGMYWMPPEPAHTHWDGMPAIFRSEGAEEARAPRRAGQEIDSAQGERRRPPRDAARSRAVPLSPGRAPGCETVGGLPRPLRCRGHVLDAARARAHALGRDAGDLQI